MEFLQDQNKKTLYDKSKHVVRKWEINFKKKSGRLPSKLDIREASSDVRNAYKLYFRLKTAALEESLTDIDGFEADLENERNHQNTPVPTTKDTETSSDKTTQLSDTSNTEKTWGLHLNKQATINDKTEKSEKLSVNLSFTQKLFENSKLKKLPRKSLSFTRKKSEVDDKPQFFSQPEHSKPCFEESLNAEADSTPLCFKTFKTVPTILSQPVNLVQTLVNSSCSFNQVRHVDKGWVQRAIADDSKNCLLEDGNDDIIANSEDELDDSCSLIQIAKKRRTSISTFLHDENTHAKLQNIDTTPKRLDFSNLFTNSHSASVQQTTSCQVEDFSNDKADDRQKDKFTKTLTDEPNEEKSESKKKSVRKTNRKVTKKTYIENEDSDNEQIGEQQQEVSNASKKKTIKIESMKKTEAYELEYSVKSRIMSVPRYSNLKTVIKSQKNVEKQSEETTDNRKTKQEEKLLKKIESGSINDNYVQINLKKKIYARGKSGRTFSKYKKQMWKKKKNALYGPDMDMGGCDGGTLTCFNCGKTGHFARNCSSNKSDSLLPVDEDEEEDCPFPTLDEAAKMAQDSALAIRPPTRSNENEVVLDGNDGNCEELNDDCDDELLAITQYLEQEINKLDVQKYMDSTTFVHPYYDLAEDGSLIDTPKEVYDTLKKFGHTTFRPGQELAIMRILSGKSTLVTLSTGTGKSLCYQLPAYLFSQREPCISLIISPLVSLMEDQVTSLPAFLKAACLHTNQTKVQREKVMELIKAGNLDILLVSPEAVVAGEKSSGFGSILRQLPPIAFACIDEAHCVSQWSHNFRPSYLKICRVLRERLSVNTVLGLTATATRSTGESIIQHLSIPDGRNGIISDVPLPDNLTLTVSKDINRDQALLTLLMSDRFKECKSIIIYCTRRETCERLATFLRTCLKNEKAVQEDSKKRKRSSVHAEPYHAGMAASRRRSIQKAFMNGDLRIVVATVAFGMGINKADIRAVIHYNMPMSFESYVQEIGRAGRDGLPAHCHLFLDFQGKDEDELKRHIYANTIDRHMIRKLLQRCFIPCSCTTCPKHEVAFSIQETVQALDIPEENIETLLCYLELHDKRYVQLLSHVYVNCRIVSYNGPNEIRKAAKDCPPLAMALALYKKNDDENPNIFEFPVVDVASTMGWDSGICKHKLKNLEWVTVNGQPKRSRLNVEFSNLGFRLMAPGNLSATSLDEALDDLYAHVQEQQKISLLQLHAITTTLLTVAKPTFKMCISDDDISESVCMLKTKIREYFESSNPFEELPELTYKPINEEEIKSDTRALVCMYRDNTFTGRAVARIFHGIQSPNYPAIIWGRCKFWRMHLGTDFNSICLIATKEILRMRDI